MNQIINDLLIVLNNIGSGFCNHAVSMFAQSGVLIILLLIIDFMLRKKVRAVFRYCVWMLVFIKLILPPTLSLPTGIGYWCGSSLSPKKILLKPIADNTFAAESIVPDISEDFVINSKSAQARSSPVASESATAITPARTENLSKITEPTQDQSSQPFPKTAAPITSAVTALPPITWQAIVFLLWLAGIFVFFVLLIQRMLFILGLIAQSKPTQGRLLKALDQCRRQVGIGRNVELRLSSHVQSPAVCGFFKPVILMPTTLLEELSQDKLRAVLIHELVHIKRCDLWVNFVQTFLQIIYFYNPFVWLANSLVRRIREQAVDEAVLVAMGAKAKSYSNILIDIAEMAFFRTSFGLRLIGVAESKKSLHRRIRHMLSRPIPQSARVGVFGTFVIFVIAAVLLPMASAEKPVESKEPIHQDITSTVPETVTPFVLRIRAFIDGSDYIKIRGDKLWYEHLKWDLPGKWWDRLENIKYDEPTYINGEAWKPEWEGRMSKPYIMKQVILPKEVNEHINLAKISGRGSVSITETPKPENDYTLSILLDDNRYNQAQWYEVIIQSGLGDTTKEPAKDDSILSRTLPQIPAANDLPGTLVFRGQYKHMSRGREYGQPSELWLKQTRDKRITAVAHMPFMKATIIASGDQENRFTHYKEEQPALGDRPGYLIDLKLRDGKVLLTRQGIRQDYDGKELNVPEGALFNPNTRPDAYCAANILLRGYNLEKGKSKEFHVYDWDNTGEAFADYTIRVKHAGTESVEVPAGKFEANHFVLTQVTSADTWFKKRAGHVTDFWVLDNGVIVRVLRHREPYEIQLLGYTVPNKLPGHLSAATTVELKQRNESADAQTKAETTEKVPLPVKEGKVLAFDDFDGSLSMDWEVLRDDPTHYSLTKKPGTLTITTQEGGFAWRATDYDNLFLIDCPALPSSGVQITTCISGFKPEEIWQQAGLIFYNDDDNYVKWVCAWEVEGQRGFTFLAESNAFRESHWGFVGHQDMEKFWLRVTKRGNRYEFFISYDGESFERFEIPTSGHGTQLVDGTLEWSDGSVKKIGLFANNGLDSQAPEIDASFEFFEVRICQAEAGPQSESVKNEKPGVKTNQVVPVLSDKPVSATQKNLQVLIDSAKPGDIVIVPKGIYKEPIDINKSLTLKGELRGECVFEVTADRPAVFIDTKGKGKVTVQDLMIKWQLATSNKGIERPFALGVKDTKAEIKNCSFLPLGNFQRSPVAVRVDGFSEATISRSRFEGFEYVICYGQGTKGKTTDCLIMDCGHQGIINYSGATLHVERNVITGSRFHAVRCTGGTLHVKENLLINNANRGIYLGNRSGSGTITNNLIINNAVGIGAFASAKYKISNNVIADSSYSGIGMYKSCYLTIRDNIFLNNERGWVMFDKGDKGGNTSYRNTFWKNKVDDENFKKTGNSINADPGFIDPENGDFSLKPGPALQHKQGLTNPEVFKALWKVWKNRKDKNVLFVSKIERHSVRSDEKTEDRTIRKADYSSITLKEGIGFDDIVVGNPDCRKEFVRSKLGTPDEEMDRWLSYKKRFGLDFWFSNNGVLGEIRANPGFRGQLIRTGISLASSKRDVFMAYGYPLEEKEIDNLHRQNDHRILYKKGSTSRIYYEDASLIFWFKGDRINQIVTFPKT